MSYSFVRNFVPKSCLPLITLIRTEKRENFQVGFKKNAGVNLYGRNENYAQKNLKRSMSKKWVGRIIEKNYKIGLMILYLYLFVVLVITTYF